MKELQTLLLVAGAFICHFASAQDIIITRESDIIRAVVKEIDENDIVYKDFDNQDGPVYRIGQSKVLKIRFQNGKEQEFGSSDLQLDETSAAEKEAGTSTDEGVKLFSQNFCRIGLGFAHMHVQPYLKPEYYSGFSGTTSSRLFVDVLDDLRMIAPKGFILSIQLGVGNRGWTQGSTWLSASNLMLAGRPGWSIRFKGNDFRLDLMAGVYTSFDIFGTCYDGSTRKSIWKYSDYKHFDLGFCAGTSLVFGKLEIYGEIRQGALKMYDDSSSSPTSFTWSIGLGYAI